MSEPLTSDINIDVSSTSVTLDHDQSNTSMSTWSRGPGSGRWDILLDEAERFRLYLSKKKAVLNDKYGGFHDEELSFPDDNLNFTLPESLSGIDRVSVSSQLQEMLKKENHTLFHGRFYRDRCTELEQRCRELKNEKEGVRYFWQNKVLESQSRGGKILMMAKQSSTSTSVD